MAKSPAFQFYPKDWQTDEKVMLMTLEQEGAYMRLLGHQWLHESIPADVESLARICRTDDETMGRIWEKVGTCFVEAEDGRLYNERLERQRQEMADFSERKSEAGKKGAKSRWQKHSTANGSATDVPLANDGPADCRLQSAGNTHKNAGAREDSPEPDNSPPPTPPATAAGGSSPATDPEEATDGPPPATATRRGVAPQALTDWERWNALGLPLPDSVPEEEHLENLSRLYVSGTRRWRPAEVEEVMVWLKEDPDPDQDWARDRGPGYLAHRPRGQPQVIEQLLTRKRKRAQGGRGGSPEPAVTTKHPKRHVIE